MKLKRWDCNCLPSEHPRGMFVLYEDVDPLLDQMAAALRAWVDAAPSPERPLPDDWDAIGERFAAIRAAGKLIRAALAAHDESLKGTP